MFENQIDNLQKHKEVRATLVELKSELTDEECIRSFCGEMSTAGMDLKAFLDDEDPKVRKNAALIMGTTGLKEYWTTLFEHYMAETTLFVRSAYLVALKNSGCTAFSEELKARKEALEKGDFKDNEVKHYAEEIKAIKALLPADSKHLTHNFKNPSKMVDVIFNVPKEFRDLFCARACGNIRKDRMKKIFCGVMVKTDGITDLTGIRLYKDFIFPLNGMKTCEKSMIPAAITGGNIWEILENVQCDAKRPFYFRITSKSLDCVQTAAQIELLSKGRLINNASNYEIEIKFLADREGRYAAFLKICSFEDKRFRYRKEYVAESMPPYKAACMIECIREYLRPDAQIIDPFCGVGTLLIERNKSVSAGYMYGTDTFNEAVLKARENTKKAGCDINYINRNFFEFKHEYLFDEIITEMPDLRKEEADDFYGKFFKKADSILKDGGMIFMYSKEKNLVRKYLRLNSSIKLVREFEADEKNGFEIFVLEKG